MRLLDVMTIIVIICAVILVGCSTIAESDWGEDVIQTPQGEATIEHVDSVDAPDDDALIVVQADLRGRIQSDAAVPATIEVASGDERYRLTLPSEDTRAAAISVYHVLTTQLGPAEALPSELGAWIDRHVAAHDRVEFTSAVHYAREVGCTHTCPWCCFCSASHMGCHSPKHDCHKQCLTAVSYMPVMHELWLVRDQWSWPGCNSEPFCWPPAALGDDGEEVAGLPGCGVGWPWCCIGKCGECSGDCARWSGVARAWGELTGDGVPDCP